MTAPKKQKTLRARLLLILLLDGFNLLSAIRAMDRFQRVNPSAFGPR